VHAGCGARLMDLARASQAHERPFPMPLTPASSRAQHVMHLPYPQRETTIGHDTCSVKQNMPSSRPLQRDPRRRARASASTCLGPYLSLCLPPPPSTLPNALHLPCTTTVTNCVHAPHLLCTTTMSDVPTFLHAQHLQCTGEGRHRQEDAISRHSVFLSLCLSLPLSFSLLCSHSHLCPHIQCSHSHLYPHIRSRTTHR
jgi:hypothetical protein